MEIYNHQKIERKWQAKWEKEKLYEVKDKKPRHSTGSPPDSLRDSKRAGASGGKFYCLDMFPYPSAEGLHVGHPEGYTASDIFTRYLIMRGYNVLRPMGFDAFGLPAENYALKTGIHPKVSTEKNINKIREQIKSLGFAYDWSREIITSDPSYYKWTQWIFLKMFKKRLAYQDVVPINWCPSCKTGLANEEVIAGTCERCHHQVERRAMKQWLLRITNYADRLLKDLDGLDWPESIKLLQKNWIGRSEGALIKFPISSELRAKSLGHGAQSSKPRAQSPEQVIEVFTTRSDTLFGATYLVLAPEHPLIEKLEARIKNHGAVKKYIEEAKKKSDLERTELAKEKTGVELNGIKAINPANKEEILIWVADYVLSTYGTGAIMAVPFHDERDFEFAKKYNLPIKQVIAPYFSPAAGHKDFLRSDKKTIKRKTVYAFILNRKENKFLCLDWEKYGWHSGIIGGVDEGESYQEAALREIREETGYTKVKYIKDLGGEQHNHFFAAHKDENRYAVGQGLLFELIDDSKESISDEHTKNHKAVWIKASEMDNWLNLSAFKYMWEAYKFGRNCFTGEGKMINSGKFSDLESKEGIKKITNWLEKENLGKPAINYKLRDWVFSRQRYWGEPIPIIHCEKCGLQPVPEKELPLELPEVKEYKPTGTGESPLAAIKEWVNTKCPNCGGKAKRETDTMPQWAGSCWYYLRFCDPHNKKEFASQEKLRYWLPVDLYVGGAEHAVLHLLYARFWHKFLYDEKLVPTPEPFHKLKNQGIILGVDGQKMSKSRGNIINPDDIIKEYGADTMRMYEMFMGPFEMVKPWDTKGIIGIKRFLDRINVITQRILNDRKKLSRKNNHSRSIHKTIKNISEDIENFKFNTAISKLMIFFDGKNGKSDWRPKLNSNNEWEIVDKTLGIAIDNFALQKFLIILAPFAPHLTEEIWSKFRLNDKSIHQQDWPIYDSKLAKEEEVELVVQVNGKLRDKLLAPADISEQEAIEIAMASEKVKKFIAGKEIKKKIFVKGRLLNIVVK